MKKDLALVVVAAFLAAFSFFNVAVVTKGNINLLLTAEAAAGASFIVFAACIAFIIASVVSAFLDYLYTLNIGENIGREEEEAENTETVKPSSKANYIPNSEEKSTDELTQKQETVVQTAPPSQKTTKYEWEEEDEAETAETTEQQAEKTEQENDQQKTASAKKLAQKKLEEKLKQKLKEKEAEPESAEIAPEEPDLTKGFVPAADEEEETPGPGQGDTPFG